MENDNAPAVVAWGQHDQNTVRKIGTVCWRCESNINVVSPKNKPELDLFVRCRYTALFCDDEWTISESVRLRLANGTYEKAVMLENANDTGVSSEDLSLSKISHSKIFSLPKLVRSQKQKYNSNKNKTQDNKRLDKILNYLNEFLRRNHSCNKYETPKWLHQERFSFFHILFLLVFISGILCESAVGLGEAASFSNESRLGQPRQSWPEEGNVDTRARFNILDDAGLPRIKAERNGKLNCSKQQNGTVVSAFKRDLGKLFLNRLYKRQVSEDHLRSTHSDRASVPSERKMNTGGINIIFKESQIQRDFITQRDVGHHNSNIHTQTQMKVRKSQQMQLGNTHNIINQSPSMATIVMSTSANEKKEPKPTRKSKLHNIVRNDGYSSNIRSLSRDGTMFWATGPAGSLDIPAVNLENAYKVRDITSEHPQTGEPSSESNSIFRGQLQKVLSGASFSDNDFTGSRTRVKRTGHGEKSRRLKVRDLSQSYKSENKKGHPKVQRHIFSGSGDGRVILKEGKVKDTLRELQVSENATEINLSQNINDSLVGEISVHNESVSELRSIHAIETSKNLSTFNKGRRKDQSIPFHADEIVHGESRLEPLTTTNKISSSHSEMSADSQQEKFSLERQIRSVDGEAESLPIAATDVSDHRPDKMDQTHYNGVSADEEQIHSQGQGKNTLLMLVDSPKLSANKSIVKDDRNEGFKRSDVSKIWTDSVFSNRPEEMTSTAVPATEGKSLKNSTVQIMSSTEPHSYRHANNSHHKILHGGLRREYSFDYTPDYDRKVSNVYPKSHYQMELTSVLPHFANTNMTQFASSFPSTSSIELDPTAAMQFSSSTTTGLISGLNSRAQRSSNNRRGKAASEQAEAATNCSLGYFGCNDGSCVLADRFCNGDTDCPKGEDEPPHCTPCDHIYYGEVGRTYEVQVQWPRRNLRDSICNVTLVAAGGPHGDIVQVALRKFSLGKFNSHTDHGCPHGHMQIVENMRQYRPGYWCGDGVGLDIYYSETPSVTLLLTRLKMDNDLTAIDTFPGFYFKMAYKFIRQTDAIVRYGPPDEQKFTGIRSPSSPCNVRFPGCDTKPCYIQSPNFPGLYPRNSTCYYHITQNHAPFDKRALITLHQRRAQLINVKSSKQPLDTEERHLKLYDDCYYVGDYVRVYDGNSTKSPVLLTFCRGAALPEITSSGPSLLIEFTTSPYDSPNHESPWKYVNGFELVAKTKFVSRTDNVGSSCHQILTPQKNSSGWISAPLQSVTPNTTCVWEFRGRPGHVIWIIFARYARDTQVRRHHTTLCEARLTIKDGSLGANDTDLASHCRDTVPRTCDRIGRLVHGNTTVPSCGYYESYVTQGEQALIMQEYGEGSLVTKVRFLAKYEFIDARQVGEKRFSPCSRLIFNDDVPGAHKLSAPRDVFLYGRGGRKAVHCSWLIQGKSTEAVRLTIHSMKVHSSTCRTLVRPLTENLDCDGGNEPVMKLHLSEVPWEGVEVPRACLCSTEVLPLTIESRGSALLLNMTLSGMGPGDDYNHFNFEVDYEFLSKPECPGGTRRLDASSGGVLLGSQDDPGECDTRPWLLEAPIGHSFLVTLPKATQANESCSTDSRLVLRTPGSTDSIMVACPAAANDAVFRFIWPPIPGLKQETTNRAAFQHDVVRGVPQLVAQWEPRRASALSMQWAHLRDPAKEAALEAGSNVNVGGTVHCKELCETLGACLVRELWCDGTPHCPDGSDETIANCLLERIPWLYLTMVGLTSLVLILISASTIARQHRQKSSPDLQNNHHLPPPPHPAHHHHHLHHHHQQQPVATSKKALAREARRASTQETILPAKDNHHRLSAYTPEEYTDMDFETTV